VSHSIAVFSWLPVTNRVESDETNTESTQPLWPLKVLNTAPVAKEEGNTRVSSTKEGRRRERDKTQGNREKREEQKEAERDR
jgi:hypothetical protein